MTIATYRHDMETEYLAGYCAGCETGEDLLRDQASAVVPEVIADQRAEIATAPLGRLSLAFCLGRLRGLRHSTWEVR